MEKKYNLFSLFLKKQFYVFMSYGFVSTIIHFLVHLKKPRFFVQFLIRLYSGTFKINLTEAEKKITDYETVLEFFTRKLKKNIRPIAKSQFICPVDGEIIEQGKISAKKFKIKNSSYSIDELVGKEIAPIYEKGGYYISLYLSPRDYHRIHHPATATLNSLLFINGRVFPVNHFSTSQIKNVFTQNRRLIAHYQKEKFSFTKVMVGALNVGGIKTTFDKNYNQKMKKENFKKVDLKIKKGEESFVFELGSSIVLLFPNIPNKEITFLQKKGKVKMGQELILIK